MNRNTGQKITSEGEHIRQSIADILLTPIGSRIQRRDYGSLIPQLIDRPINHALLLQLSASAVMALNKWEKRVQVSAFKPKVEEDKIQADLTITNPQSGKISTLNNLILSTAQGIKE